MPDARGTPVLLAADGGNNIFLAGDGACRMATVRSSTSWTSTRKTLRLLRSEAPFFERPVLILDPRNARRCSAPESKEDPPNYFVRDLRGGLTRLTDFPHPTPQLADVQKELIRYEREDGVKLTGTLYLPPGYKRPRTDPCPCSCGPTPTSSRAPTPPAR